MARAFVFIIGIVFLVGTALLVSGLADGQPPTQRLAAKCTSSAESGGACQVGRSGYGIDDVALEESPASTATVASEPKGKKRSFTAKRPEPVDVEAHAAEVETSPASARDEPRLSAQNTAPARPASPWKDPEDPVPAARSPVPAPAPQRGPSRIATLDETRPLPAGGVSPAPAERAAPAPARPERPAALEPAAESAPARAASERPKARPRFVAARSERSREVKPAIVVAAKPLDITPDVVVRRPAPERAAVRRSDPRPALAVQRERLRVASPTLLPPRPIPDRPSAAASAFPPGFQAALRDYNARYSMFRRGGSGPGED